MMKGWMLSLAGVVLVSGGCVSVDVGTDDEAVEVVEDVPAPRITTAVEVTPYPGDQQDLLTHSDPVLASNKRIAFDFFRVILRGQQLDQAASFMAEDYIQHNPNADTGLEGFLVYFREFGGGPSEVQDTLPNLVAIQAEGEYVTLSFVREYEEPGMEDQNYTTTWFDMFRIVDGRIAEHWDPATK